jgi:hypothetical protein
MAASNPISEAGKVAMIDANASSIENALMAFVLGMLVIAPAAALLYLVRAWRRSRRQPQSFFDIIGKRGT